MGDNIKSAFASIWSNKIRSLLTLLGVVIGVSSVTTLVALGQGLKSDVGGLIQGLGTNIVAVVPGKLDALTSATGSQKSTGNPADSLKGDILTPADLRSLEGLESLEAVAPFSLVSGTIKQGSVSAINPVIVGSNPDIAIAMASRKIAAGRMFTESERGVIVLSSESASQLFPNDSALNQKVTIGPKSFTVIGVYAKSVATSALSGSYDTISVIPFDDSTVLNKNQPVINRIITKAVDSADVKAVKLQIHDTLLKNHNGEDNFSVLTQDDLLGIFDTFLNLATAMVSAIAAISLLVGGIGIMNIMLVTVTERTREIGLRKALGATRGAILVQFLVEAVVVTLVGGLLGLGISFVTGLLIAANSPLKPEFSVQVLLLTVGISVVIGVIFGLWPALRAARKDPIEALRYE